VLCAASDYLKARGRPNSIDDLLKHDLLIHWRAGYSYPWRLPDANGHLTEVKLPSRLRFDDLEVTADAAVAGMGIAWLPYWLVRERIRTGALFPLWAERPVASMESHALWPAAEHLPLRVRLAIDTLVEELPDTIGIEAPPRRSGRRMERVVPNPSVPLRARRRAP
jgi:DNA-binding transcriptional LysR family regulator